MAADGLWRAGEPSVVNTQPRLVLQPLLGSSQGSAGLGRVVAGRGVLREFCKVAMAPALVHVWNQMCINFVKTKAHIL